MKYISRLVIIVTIACATIIMCGLTKYLILAFAALVAGILIDRQFLQGSSDQQPDENAFRQINPVSQLYDDLYGVIKPKKRRGLISFLFGDFEAEGPAMPKNIGFPSKQYFELTHWNSKLDSYKFSMTRTIDSKAKAAADFRQISFQRALRKALGDDLEQNVQQRLLQAEETLLKKGSILFEKSTSEKARHLQDALDREMKYMGMTSLYALSPSSRLQMTERVPSDTLKELSLDKKTGICCETENASVQEHPQVEERNLNHSINESSDEALDEKQDEQDNSKGEPNEKRQNSEPASTCLETGKKAPFEVSNSTDDAIHKLEIEFCKDVIRAVGPTKATAVRTALLGDYAVRGGLLANLQDQPLHSLLSARKPKLFVVRFSGDVRASQVSSLREEVTAIIRSADPGDEALLILKSGGGTVTGYGLATAQILRFKEAGMKLTVAVDEVAASGGYMMASVADKIVASPLAILGSIGVVQEIPNFYERLQREGVDVQLITAGKYKRTLTSTKKVTEEDIEESKRQMQGIFKQLVSFIAKYRPQVDIDKVQTGETWFGTDALELHLCDEIKTVDAVLTDFVDQGYDVFEIQYKPPPSETSFLSRIYPMGETKEMPLLVEGIRWLTQAIASEISANLGVIGKTSEDQTYLSSQDRTETVAVMMM